MSEIRVGIGVIVLNPKNQILAAKRKALHGQGTWALVGGHLEFGETFKECARRETMEEAGLELQNIRMLATAEHFFKNGTKHYVTIYMIGRVGDETPQLLEPDSMEEWQYFDTLADVPQPHFVLYAKDLDQSMIDAFIRNEA